MNFSPELWQGESRVITLQITDPDTNQPPDLTSGKWQLVTCEWQVKTLLDGPDPALISKSIGAGAIVIQSGGDLGKIEIFIDPTDTAGLTPATYVHDVAATFTSGARIYLVKPSALPVLGVVNQL